MRRLVAGALAALVAIVVAVWAPSGCVNPNTKAQRAQRESFSEVPDGGWQNYKPPRRDWQPDPARHAAENPLAAPVVPITPGSPSVSPTVH